MRAELGRADPECDAGTRSRHRPGGHTMPPRNQAPRMPRRADAQDADPPARRDLPVTSHQLPAGGMSAHHPGRPRRRRPRRSLLAAPALIAAVAALSVNAAGAGPASAAGLIDSELNAVAVTSGGSAWA